MSQNPADGVPILYIVATGAPLSRRVPDGVIEARERGWWPAVVETESAGQWLDHEQRSSLDVPVIGQHREPREQKRLPRADAVLLAPATFNTVNKLATGIADTYATSVLCEALGDRTPMVVVPFVNARLAGHPAWLASLAVLRYAGVVLSDPHTGGVNTHEPLVSGTGDKVTEAFQWSWPLSLLDPETSAAQAL